MTPLRDSKRRYRRLCVGGPQHDHVKPAIGATSVVSEAGELGRTSAENLVGFRFRCIASDDVDGRAAVLNGCLCVGPQVVYSGRNRRDAKVPGLESEVFAVGNTKYRTGPLLTGLGSRRREHHDRKTGEQLSTRSAATRGSRNELVERRRDL